jgi:hypothetical protein
MLSSSSLGSALYQTMMSGVERLSGVLDGANLADLPIARSIRFSFAIKFKAAKTFGVEIPRGLLNTRHAHEV